MDIIAARNLTVGYDTSRILSGLDFDIPEVRITAIVGTSGCGKSTLLKTLAGLIPPLEGELFFGSERVDFQSESSLASLYHGIGVLFQDGALLNNLTLFDNVALPVRMHHPDMPEAVLRQMVNDRLAQVNLLESAAKAPSELSGGMRKRGALARALVLDPAVVLCDEPSGGLDPITSGHLDDLFLRIRETFRTTFVVVTHELRSIERIADRVLILWEGRLHFSGTLAEVLASDDGFIRTFFLRKADHDDT
ncbi:MAG TPA: ATP-binding cassette domain-containing protein [Terriglobales bacterium]|nr:ATP-binding cassette domain-containing protein [Terriglobales bacterium]